MLGAQRLGVQRLGVTYISVPEDCIGCFFWLTLDGVDNRGSIVENECVYIVVSISSRTRCTTHLAALTERLGLSGIQHCFCCNVSLMLRRAS